MQNLGVRLLIGLGMFLMALVFTGMLASALEQRARDGHPVESYAPPRVPGF